MCSFDISPCAVLATLTTPGHFSLTLTKTRWTFRSCRFGQSNERPEGSENLHLPLAETPSLQHLATVQSNSSYRCCTARALEATERH